MSMRTRAAIAFLLCTIGLPAVALAQRGITYAGQTGPGQGRHIVFLSGDEEYRSEEALPMLAKILSQRHGFTCTVPAGHYFMMGDNRDQSSDSRYWGFVPDDHIKGRAFLVWMNFNDFKRIGNGIE